MEKGSFSELMNKLREQESKQKNSLIVEDGKVARREVAVVSEDGLAMAGASIKVSDNPEYNENLTLAKAYEMCGVNLDFNEFGKYKDCLPLDARER